MDVAVTNKDEVFAKQKLPSNKIDMDVDFVA